MSTIYILAALLLVLAVLILARNLGLHWRGSLLAGILALWLWGMAFTLAHFIDFCRNIGSQGVGDPSQASEAMTQCLVTCASTNMVAVPLMILCSVIFFIHRPRELHATSSTPTSL